MRRIFLASGPLVLGLAAMLWVTAASGAQRGGHGGGHGHAGGGHSAVHVGSVHYAGRPAHDRVAPVRAGPAVRSGAVRSEHYTGSVSRGAYRNPYREEYARHFRPGYRPYLLGDAQYYGYDSLPLGYQQVELDGMIYYLFDGVYYQAYIYGGQTVYVAVPAPV